VRQAGTGEDELKQYSKCHNIPIQEEPEQVSAAESTKFPDNTLAQGGRLKNKLSRLLRFNVDLSTHGPFLDRGQTPGRQKEEE
jgi:hypothetical protein